MLLAAILCLLGTAVAASPQVNFPLALQLPPVARVGEAYNFQFAETTFQPDPHDLVYSIASGPSWLHIHSENRTLWGTPSTKDAGTATFTIAAAGEAGAVVNMESELPVEEGEAPKANANISQALSKAGQLSDSRKVTLLPSSPFEITLGPDVFEADGKKLMYNATLADHTPLPGWMSFDAQKVRFAGTTPPTADTQTFEILLITSDTPDYATASLSFTLVVSTHILLFKPMAQTLNISKGAHVQVKGLKEMVYLDRSPIRDEDIESVSADVPSWLSFDTKTFDINGDPPSGLMSQDISVTVHDRYGGSAKHSIHLAFPSELFSGEVGRLNITAGSPFEYKIPKSILAQESEKVSFEFGKLNKWLSFDKETLTVKGTVPADTQPCEVEGSMMAVSPDGRTRDTQTFKIEVLGSSGSSNRSPSNADTKDDDANNGTVSAKRKKVGIIVGSVLSAVFAAAIIFAFILFFCRRRKPGHEGYISPPAPRSPRKTDISRPIPMAAHWEDIEKAEDVDDKVKFADSLPRPAERPPQLALPLPAKRKFQHAHATSLDETEDHMLTSFHQSLAFSDESEPYHHPHDSMKLPTESLRRISSGSQTKHRSSNMDVYRDSYPRGSGVPYNRRLAGLGSARHTYSPSRSTTLTAMQRTLSSSSRSTATHSMSMASTVPSAHPQPSKARHTAQLTTPIEHKRSVRLVASSTYASLLDRRTLDEKRKSYIRKRASAQSPFFGGNSRVSSQSYKCAPGFIGDSSPPPKSPLSSISPNIMRSNESAPEHRLEHIIHDSLRIRKPADTPSPTTTLKPDYSRSLRKHRPARSYLRRNTSVSLKTDDSEPEKDKPRPETAVYSPPAVYSPTGWDRSRDHERDAAYSSLRGTGLRMNLNKMTGKPIFTDEEMSESNYSGEEDDIEEAERRATMRPSSSVKYTIGPLNFEKGKGEKRDSKRVSKRNSKRDSKRGSKRTSRLELKHISEREATPYRRLTDNDSLKENDVQYQDNDEKENSSANNNDAKTSTQRPPIPISDKHASTYSVTNANPYTYTAKSFPLPPSSALQTQTKPKSRPTTTTSSSPTRPKTSHGAHRPTHSRNYSRLTYTPSPSPSQSRHTLGSIPCDRERHSRKSMHSRTQSRISISAATAAAAAGPASQKKPRDRSRTQSGAYPRLRESGGLMREIGAAEGKRASRDGEARKRDRDTVVPAASSSSTAAAGSSRAKVEADESGERAEGKGKGKGKAVDVGGANVDEDGEVERRNGSLRGLLGRSGGSFWGGSKAFI